MSAPGTKHRIWWAVVQGVVLVLVVVIYVVLVTRGHILKDVF